MKNLKKLSRNDLKSLVGGKRLPVDGCANMCMPRMGTGPADICEQYGLTCG